MAKKTAAAKTDPGTMSVETTEAGQGNLKLWRQVDRTPPAMTKPVSYGSRKFTAVDPQWQLRVFTALWGPYGNMWGLRDLSYTVHAVEDGRAVVILTAEFFYPLGEKRASFPIVNDEELKPGQDTMKKLVTNTRSKALSWLGASADVYMGRFDSVAFVESSAADFAEGDAAVSSMWNDIKECGDAASLRALSAKVDRMIADGTMVDPAKVQVVREKITEKEQELLA